MSSAADRNLLFGILALQMDFITRDQLIEGMNAWVLNKERALGDILVKRGALAAADQALLAPMVERHIQMHGGDVARSLVKFSTMGRGLLGSIADPEVQASLCHLSPHAQDDPIAESVAYQPEQAEGKRYVIERPHAKGGLGEVFVARDTELNRTVALKHIQNTHADDPGSRSRFLIEGEVTGRLEHPGIVPVYGMGHYADGRPYYAMRFVQGETLRDAIRRFHDGNSTMSGPGSNLAFRDLLQRFLDVCNAVAYAHRRGVLHRDLKPSNVLLGEFGETLVIDWGMAKVIGAEEPDNRASTVLGDPLVPSNEPLATIGHRAHGTPGYMSPEQAAGRIDELGPATDIYSLGAMLYHLLTGRPPLTGEDGDMIGRTIRGDFPHPGKVKRGVPRALKAVCLKALALAPKDRYSTVQELAKDVQTWLGDEPVSAWREPIGVRARRWVRKNPGRVAGLTAGVLVGLMAAIGGSMMLGAKNRELASTNTSLDSANSSLRTTIAERDTANENLKNALNSEQKERERADDRTRLADERFTLALDAFKKQVFDANAMMKNRPGTQELRKAIMGQAVEGLQKLVREAEKTQGADRVRAVAHCALGEVYLKIDGRMEKGRREYQLAFDLLKRLAEGDPKDAQAQRDLSISYNKLGDVLLQQGEVQKALEMYQEGLTIRKRLAETDPKDARAQRDLSISYDNLGDVLRQQGEVQKALEMYQEGLTIRKRLAEADPKDAQAQRDLSVSYNKLGNVLLQQGEVQTALGQYQEGPAIRKRLADGDPHNFEAQTDLVFSYDKLGSAEKQRSRYIEAAASFEKALAVLRPWQEAGKLKGTRFADWPSTLESEQRYCRDAMQSLGELEGLLQLPGTKAADLLALRAELMAQQGKHMEAATAATKLAEIAKDGPQHYSCAHAFAWCSRDKGGEVKHAVQCLAHLAKARDAGFFKETAGAKRLTSNEAFKPLLNRDDFKKFLAELEKD